jgi:hypothetical protein
VSKWLTYLAKPTKLVLAWQPDDAMGDRFRWAVGEVTRCPEGCALRYYSESEFELQNSGRRYGKLTDFGYRGTLVFRRRLACIPMVSPKLFCRLPPPEPC